MKSSKWGEMLINKQCIFVILLSFLLIGCSVRKESEEPEMPLIVFQFSLHHTSYHYPNTRGMWTIDNQGDIYYFNNIYNFEYGENEDVTLYYEKLKQDKYTRYVGTVEQEVLNEKYEYLREIIKDKHYEKNISGIDDNAFTKPAIYLGQWSWSAYFENRKGDVKIISLHKWGDSFNYTSEDERMKELADWLDELLEEDINENGVRSRELQTKEHYMRVQQYIKDSQKK